jgi:HEAT repeat protein
MPRTLLALPLCLLLLSSAAPARAQQDEPEFGGRKASEWMKMLINDSRPKARRIALTALEVIGPKADRVLATLIYVMSEDKDAELRREVAQTLGRMGEDARGAVKALMRVLGDDKDGLVREAAARALGAMAPHSRNAVGDLGKALDDKHPGTRAAAAAALKDLAAEAKSALPNAIAALKAHKGKDDGPTRIYLAKLVGLLAADAKAAIPVLGETVGDTGDDPRVREAAAEALGRFGQDAESTVKQLGAAVSSDKAKPDRDLRKAALLALGKVSSDPKLVWPFVKGVLGEADGSLRLQAVRTAGPLGKTEQEIVRALAERAAKDLNVDVRLAAIQELGALGAAARPALGTLKALAADEPRPALRDAARAALKNIPGNP